MRSRGAVPIVEALPATPSVVVAVRFVRLAIVVAQAFDTRAGNAQGFFPIAVLIRVAFHAHAPHAFAQPLATIAVGVGHARLDAAVRQRIAGASLAVARVSTLDTFADLGRAKRIAGRAVVVRFALAVRTRTLGRGGSRTRRKRIQSLSVVAARNEQGNGAEKRPGTHRCAV